jgi:signal transduction histidine kinase
LFLNNEVENRFEEVATLDGKVEPLEFLSGPGGSGVAGWAADMGKILFLQDRTRADGFDPENGYATFLSIPLLTTDRILGVASFGCREPYAFSADAPVSAKYIGELLVMALERLEDKSDLEMERKSLEELRSSCDRLNGLVSRLEKLETVAELAAATNHEINDLLSVIVGNTQCLLVTSTTENQKSLHRIRRIEKAALQMSNANHNLLKIRELLNDSLSEEHS